MLAIAAFYEIWQMDNKTAILNGFIKKELYMMHPEGFVDPKDAKRYAGSSDPSKDWSEHLGVGMYALMMIEDFGFVQSL